MQTLTQQLIEAGLANLVISDNQLARLLGGSSQRRHNLVNRALKVGEIQRLKRGRYFLDAKYRDYPAHPFVLAQAYVAGSYISFETALAHHGWIPEAVYVTASATPRSKTLKFETPNFGHFSFHPLAIEPGYFLEMVVRTEVIQQSALVAAPARALMDLVCLRKVEWQGMGWLSNGLRIDQEQLISITKEQIKMLQLIYKQKRIQSFISALSHELGHD